MDLTARRRVVFTVLSDYLSGDCLWQVLAQWESPYSKQSQFELNKFLANCSHIDAIAQNRSAIYRQMIALLMAPDAQRLKADPLVALELFKKRGAVRRVWPGQTISVRRMCKAGPHLQH